MMRAPFSVIAVFIVCALGSAAAHAEAYTKVYVNGVATPVFFNDGDSFRMQAGEFKGVQARLSGYNTLESFGAVHSWGTWTEKEMFVIAKLATLQARKGVWHCEGDGKKDGYGRMLLFCKDLASYLIRNGLAHAYSVDENPADPDLLAVQKLAMKERRGMWAHGIPRYVMTSLHSKAEGGDKNGKTSNRLISTSDGHSDKWEHDDDYAECQKVCHEVPAATDADLDAIHAALKTDAEAGGVASAMEPAVFKQVMRILIEKQQRGEQVIVTDGDHGVSGAEMPAGVTEAQLGPLFGGLTALAKANKLTISGKQKDSCQIYVDFKRRFGGERAECLRK
jgi:endonuclease YncB( thermonuclease family)